MACDAVREWVRRGVARRGFAAPAPCTADSHSRSSRRWRPARNSSRFARNLFILHVLIDCRVVITLSETIFTRVTWNFYLICVCVCVIDYVFWMKKLSYKLDSLISVFTLWILTTSTTLILTTASLRHWRHANQVRFLQFKETRYATAVIRTRINTKVLFANQFRYSNRSHVR